MNAWTAGALAISMTGPGGHVLIASAPYGQAGTKEWRERAALMAAAPDLLATLNALLDMDVAYQRGPAVANAVENARAAVERARVSIATAGQP